MCPGLCHLFQYSTMWNPDEHNKFKLVLFSVDSNLFLNITLNSVCPLYSKYSIFFLVDVRMSLLVSSDHPTKWDLQTIAKLVYSFIIPIAMVCIIPIYLYIYIYVASMYSI